MLIWIWGIVQPNQRASETTSNCSNVVSLSKWAQSILKKKPTKSIPCTDSSDRRIQNSACKHLFIYIVSIVSAAKVVACFPCCLSGKSRGTAPSRSPSTGPAWTIPIWPSCAVAAGNSNPLTTASLTSWAGSDLSWEICRRWASLAGTSNWWLPFVLIRGAFDCIDQTVDFTNHAPAPNFHLSVKAIVLTL